MDKFMVYQEHKSQPVVAWKQRFTQDQIEQAVPYICMVLLVVVMAVVK